MMQTVSSSGPAAVGPSGRTTRVQWLLRLGASFLFSGVLSLGVLAGGPSRADGAPGEISPAELSSRIEDKTAPVIIDVRSRGEFQSGHIAGAIHIPHSEIAERLAEIPADKADEIVVYCAVGGRAKRAEATLEAADFKNIRMLSGHMRGWIGEDKPVVSP